MNLLVSIGLAMHLYLLPLDIYLRSLWQNYLA